MVDTPTPPPPPPPAPPKDTGPDEGSDEWIKVQETRNKRKAFGAGVSFVTEEKIRQFVIEMTFKAKIDETTDATTLNLHAIHLEFVAKLFAITKGDTHLLPTAKDNSSDTSMTTKSPIVSVDGFPTSDRLHRKFFHRQVYYNEYTKRTVIKIKHEVLMKETVQEAKIKLLDWLQSKRIWMKNGELDSVETSSIGWLLAAHPTYVFKPTVASRLNALVASLPRSTIDAQVEALGTPDDLKKLPILFVNTKWQPFGVPPNRVTTQAVTISCVKNRTRLMKELISLIPADKLPYTFIPIGLATMENPDAYKKFIVINNDRTNEVQGIAVKGFSKELLARQIHPTIQKTVAEYIQSFKSIISIQETHQSEAVGRYVIIIYKAAYTEAKEMLQDLCEAKFRVIYADQDQRDQYRLTYKSLPHLADTPSAGGATASHGAHLVALLKHEEERNGKPFSATPTTTWANIVAPRMFTFDERSNHPEANNNKDNDTTILPAKTQTAKTNTSNTDNNSTNSMNTSSTLAPTAQITASGQTVVSQDLSSVVSQMKSMASEQTKLIETLFERQDKQARRAAKEATRAAKEFREFNQQMMQMMMDLILDNKSQNRRNRKRTSSRPDREHHKKQSKMWQSAKQENKLKDDASSSDGTSSRYDGHDFDDIYEKNKSKDDQEMSLEASNQSSEENEMQTSSSSSSSNDSDDEESITTADIDAQLLTKHEAAGAKPTPQTRDSPFAPYGLPSPKMPTKITTQQQKKHTHHSTSTPSPIKTTNMSPAEALQHTAEKLHQRQQLSAAREDTKRSLIHTPPSAQGRNSPPGTHESIIEAQSYISTPNKTKQRATIPPPPPLPNNERTRSRSPGNTPDATKIQRTGTAPTRPTTQTEIAMRLNFEEAASPSSAIKAPDPPDLGRKKQE